MERDIFETGKFYHVYNRGNNHENLFLEEKNYYYFLEKVEKYLVPICDIYAYCLLKNHFHLVLRIKDEKDLPEKYKGKIHLPFSNMFNSYSKSINKMYGRSGSLFQEHLHRNRIEDESYLKQLILYVHLNPVKHNFSKKAEDYKWSSYRSYQSEKISKIDREFILNLFDGLENFIHSHDEKRLVYEGIINEIDVYDD